MNIENTQFDEMDNELSPEETTELERSVVAVAGMIFGFEDYLETNFSHAQSFFVPFNNLSLSLH